MINRVFIKELLSFEQIELEFANGLVVITGPSGAGKSVFMGAILANFGLANQESKLCEIEISKPNKLSSDVYELDEEIIVKSLKKDRVRYFIDGQNISKKALKELFKDIVSYISVRDKSGFESENLIEILDNYIAKSDKSFFDILKQYRTKFQEYQENLANLNSLKAKIKESNERVEFLKFEIDKIKSLNIKNGEYDELLSVKKQLSKLDKIQELSGSIEAIFEFEDSVYELFNILDKDSSYFSDSLNQLRSDFEDIESLSEELNGIDIEEVLDRLEQLNSLIKRFGSIDEALKYLAEREEELASFEKIDEDLSELTAMVLKLEKELEEMASKISKTRLKASNDVAKELNSYLKELKLSGAKFEFSKKVLGESGIDEINLELNSTSVNNLSGGEFNRVRLALLTVGAVNNGGIIILDEIDANVSGDESIAIANMISKLSESFQIFAISHQPHLSSKANEHILVTKDGNKSRAILLDKEQRVQEIARIVGGENYNKEALEFAQKLF